MKRMYFVSDLNVMVKLFGQEPSDLKVWDPDELIYPDQSWVKAENANGNNFRILIVMPSSTSISDNIKFESFELVLNFSETELNCKQPVGLEMKFIASSSGYMRWLYPRRNKNASFTNFLAATTFKMKLIKWGLKILSYLHLDSWFFSRKVQIFTAKNPPVCELVKEFDLTNFSINMGSQGINRTAIIHGNSSYYGELFVKVPINKESINSIKREKRAINRVRQFDFEFIKLPEMVESSNLNILVTKALGGDKTNTIDRFTELHFNAIKEVVRKSIRVYKLEESPFWLELQHQMAKIRTSFIDDKLKIAINKLYAQLNNADHFYTCIAHGDFTPWNMFIAQSELHVYDWELADGQYPLFYDLFHFHFQNGVLVRQLSYHEIEKLIVSTCLSESIQQFIETYQIDIRFYFQMYLLKSAIKNVLENANCKQINYQNSLLRDTLLEALEFNCDYLSCNHRQQFIRDFNGELEKYSHGYLKLLNPEIEELPLSSDLDIAINKSEVNSLVLFVKSHSLVKKVVTIKKSFMATIEIQFKNSAFLSIDLIHQFKRRAFAFSDINELLHHSIPNSKGYMVPLPEHDFEYAALFYLLNGSPIPAKYVSYFSSLKNSDAQPILMGFKEKYGLNVFKDTEIINGDTKVCKLLRKEIRRSALLSGAKGLKNCFHYCVDSFNAIFKNKAVMVTLSGVDGVGKSTVIQLVKSVLEQTYRKKVVLLRHRPGILPILSSFIYGKKKAEYISSVTIPRQGGNKSILSSLLRFAYYYTDYIFGQFFVYFKYTSRGVVVLYDRYYFDFINDASRSNIKLSSIWIEKLYALIFKPDLNIFLYETPEVILKRKQEMDASQIEEVTLKYRSFFNRMNSRDTQNSFRCIRNRNLKHTLDEVFELYQLVS